MLIIFDLDDTLIATSDFITPWRFNRVAQILKKDGFSDETLEYFVSEMTQAHAEFSSSQEALEFFLKKFEVSCALHQECLECLNLYDLDIPVRVYPGVYELLHSLKKSFKMVLVTSGQSPIQNLKIQKASLHHGFFENVMIVESGSKEFFYKKIYDEFKPSQILVIGDRVQKDLKPAKNLGFLTVLVQQGRGQFQKFHKDEVDFVIRDVTELENLIKSFPNP